LGARLTSQNRCQRLKKDCLTSTSTRRRSINKSPVSRTARLEQKVDGLVSLLRSQATVNHLHPGLSDTPLLPTQPIQVGIQTPQSTINVSPSQISDDVSDRTIPNTLTEEHLAKFRQSFLPFFPFVYIPTAMSASDLRIQKPFLSLAILSLTTKSTSQQLTIFDTIRRIVSEKVVAEHERSLDFLLGLVCYLAWSFPLSAFNRRLLTEIKVPISQKQVVLEYVDPSSRGTGIRTRNPQSRLTRRGTVFCEGELPS
jgi:hypothetical protein